MATATNPQKAPEPPADEDVVNPHADRTPEGVAEREAYQRRVTGEKPPFDPATDAKKSK